jgi:hypothetical protein
MSVFWLVLAAVFAGALLALIAWAVIDPAEW